MAARPRRLHDRFATRLVAGILLAFLPLIALLAVLLVRNASDSLEEAARAALRNFAVQLSDRVDGRTSERRNTLRALAQLVQEDRRLEHDEVLKDFRAGFEQLELVDLRGRVVATTDRRATPLARVGESWFATATRGAEAFAHPVLADGTLRTIVAQPVRGSDGVVRRILLGDLDETVFATFVTTFELGETGEAVIRDATGRLVWRTALGPALSPRDMAMRNALADRATQGAPGLALDGGIGTVEFRASTGQQAVGGYAPAEIPGWAVDVRQDVDEAFAPIDDQRNLAIAVALAGGLLLTLLAVLFARRTTRPLRTLAREARRVAEGDLTVRVRPEGAAELRELGQSFNSMVERLGDLVGRLRAASADLATAAAQLSAGSQQMASTTTDQSSSAAGTSAVMQDLAATSESIALSVGVVERRASDTRDALAQADRVIADSSERMRALAERAREVGATVDLINDIADRTDLLALNAAIEAARAGEAGAGFSVVAEEVRRLAERSKVEAKKIGELVAATQEQAEATVAAMDRGSTLTGHGLQLMEQVTGAVAGVSHTTDEQRRAADEVVGAMESVTAASRQAAVAGQQIAVSATQLARLAADLDGAARTFRTAGDDDRDRGADSGPPAAGGARPRLPAAAHPHDGDGSGDGAAGGAAAEVTGERPRGS